MARPKEHGHAGPPATAVYRVWSGMKRRCSRLSDPAFPDYGGRGIKVCARWLDFANFLADMGEPAQGQSIDRIDVNGDYEPGNCRWATRIEQANNTRKSRYVVFRGKRLTRSEFAQATGVSRELVEWRLNRGWHPEKAAQPPRPWIRKQP